MDTGSPITEFIKAFFIKRGIPYKGTEYHNIAGDGSSRLFRRIIPHGSGPPLIVMESPPTDDYRRKENLAYLMIGRHLFKKNFPVPEIYASDLAQGWFIMEDLGDNNLQEEVTRQDNPLMLYEKVLDILFRLQIEGAQGFNIEWCCQTERYDLELMRRYESDYFRDSFLFDYIGIEKDWSELEESFDHLALTASRADNHYFLHRDFQSRNIMISDGKIGILDWQGGRLGPLAYDLASLLIDPYVALSAKERNLLFQQYVSLLKGYKREWVTPFQRYYPYLAIQRNLQVLGAYSFLTRVKGKRYFEKYIPPALQSLYTLIDEIADPKLSPLHALARSLLSLSIISG